MGLVVPADTVPERFQISHLFVAPEEQWLIAAGRFVGAPQRHRLPDIYRLPFAFEDHRLAGTEHCSRPNQLGGEGSAENLPRTGRFLEPGGHVHRVADHGAVASPADGGGHDLP